MSSSTSGGPLLLHALRAHARLLVPAVAVLCLWQACETAVPVLIGMVIDHAILPRSVRGLVIGLAALAALFTVLSLGYRFGSRLGNTAMNRRTHLLRVDVARHALHPRGVRTALLPGEVLSLATSDADVAGAVLRQVALAGSALAGVTLGTVYLFVTDWVSGVVVIIAVGLSLAATRLLTPLIIRRTTAQQERVAAASGRAADLMQGLRIIKGIGGEAAAGRRYRAASHEARDATIATTGGMALMESMQAVLMGLLVAGVILGAGLRLLGGHLTVGQLIAVVGLATFLSEPISTLIMIIAGFAQSAAAAARITAFARTEPLVPDGPRHADETAAPLRITGLRGPGVAELDLTVAPGEQVAIVAPDPRAAGTIMHVLAGEPADPADPADPAEDGQGSAGTVEVYGVPRHDLALASAQQQLLVVPHQVDLFEGTLETNVCLRRAVADLDDVLDASAASELVRLFPQGLQHPVDAAGTNLSGGQRQRIGLARALAADPPLLVLHDPTTAVDAVTESHIARSLRGVRAGRATVVLTASPAFLAAADRVVWVTQERTCVGRHPDLLADDDYRDLVGRGAV